MYTDVSENTWSWHLTGTLTLSSFTKLFIGKRCLSSITKKTERKRKNPDGICFSKKKLTNNNNHYFYYLYNGHLTETKARGNLDRKENLRNYIIGIVYSHTDNHRQWYFMESDGKKKKKNC